MRGRRLFWQLYLSYLAIVILALLCVTLYSSSALRDCYHRQAAEDLLARAALLEGQFDDLLAGEKWTEVDALAKRLGKRSATRITVVLPSGEVVGDAEEDPAVMDKHDDRPEIIAAMQGTPKPSLRYSHTLERMMMYVAVPIRRADATVGVLRTSIHVSAIDEALGVIERRIAVAGMVLAALAAGVGFWFSRRISRPLEDLARSAERLARGDFSQRRAGSGVLEVDSLADALDRMAAELDARLRTVLRERNQREAVLSSMVEGVVAVDAQQCVINLNPAAAALLGVDAADCQGRSLPELIRNPALQRLVADVLASREPRKEEIEVYQPRTRHLDAHGTVLFEGGEGAARKVAGGVLVVLHDITDLRRLEQVRRDFVANVSHELRTPITSIKGFVETLLDGAMRNPADAERFLRIVAEQTNRLDAIIEDLMTLSWVEQDSQAAGIPRERRPVRPILESAVGLCRPRIGQKEIHVELECPSDLEAEVNVALLEEAVVNLLDNAAKYSPEGKTVRLEAERAAGEIVIRVRDEGCGIGREHLPRLFERFYRVDKARSRKLGGTGLGLAIVKHIAEAHGGRVEVESALGAGSAFSIHLPDRA
ncbi:MAG: HAMP domain-containing protein [Pirellulales bacterium]|nr:HAMP domain-containing protein [Pirellulales bacterium]